jgi:hypothetical protein
VAIVANIPNFFQKFLDFIACHTASATKKQFFDYIIGQPQTFHLCMGGALVAGLTK